ncbi:MAG: hypothetical protein A2498_00990 [Lentisphaerae bacterium RIFOXYC12_FULL_60_16]|nr:MAG: hypothetical protein A2498_00990 [Lentisphaerae bacterium RIFOXYC12_FULL_60_16]
MEVDLLCPERKVVVEIDGPQHLEPAAYRTDRRKDALLQEDGYFGFGFLLKTSASTSTTFLTPFSGHSHIVGLHEALVPEGMA